MTVWALEVGAPRGQKPVGWKLIPTVGVDTLAQALEVIGWFLGLSASRLRVFCWTDMKVNFLATTGLVGGLLFSLQSPMTFELVAADAAKDAGIRSGLNGITVLSSSAAVGDVGGAGYRTVLQNGEARVPLVVVGGTPYEMGWHLGRLMKPEMANFVPAAVAAILSEMQLDEQAVARVWGTTAPYTDDRVEQEILGLSAGSGLPLPMLQAVHCLPLLMPYSCSSIAAWGDATVDGHLYQTRDLDWNLELGAHEFPVIVVFLPIDGVPHVIPSFAGFLGAHCGMNTAGLALSEMGDSPAREMPFKLQAPHFTSWFRTILYDAESLSEALEIFTALPMTKRYHFVFGDGRMEKRAVKIRAHSPERPEDRIRIWTDNDPSDELAPEVLSCVVYQDEGRGAFATIKAKQGKLDAAAMIALCNQIPIKGGNVMNAVFDATALRFWVSYAGGDKEAYQRPYVFGDLRSLDGDSDGIPDFKEGSTDSDQDGQPAFFDAEDQRPLAVNNLGKVTGSSTNAPDLAGQGFGGRGDVGDYGHSGEVGPGEVVPSK